MTLQQILYVLTIADYGSMNQAAAALYISHPHQCGEGVGTGNRQVDFSAQQQGGGAHQRWNGIFDARPAGLPAVRAAD